MAFPDPYNGSFSYGYFGFDYNFVYDGNNFMLVPKGHKLEYEKNLAFVKSIDLSCNNLYGSIPTEISVLSELNFLNLSENHLMGNIPEKIESMKELESVDLSWNHLSGEIPPSMSNLTFLSYLDLSYNNLSGRIPSSTQLQSFDAVRYIGNPQLCGDPLPKSCVTNEEFHNRTSIGKTEDDSQNSSFYLGNEAATLASERHHNLAESFHSAKVARSLKMSKVRSSDMETGLSLSDDRVISEATSPSTPYKAWTISCSLTGIDEKRIRNRF
ncbi:receptor-like protein EIX2 [Quercus suber]|uniref:receptor-like protein EIX2 n=1 Tax=Quercus suber TaxID=58331 RepID=UPI0032DFB50C